MGKHTPGPWTATIQRNRAGDDLGWIIQHGNGRIGWADLAYADTNKAADKTDPAREANAKLIAAAPDLLEALKEFVSPYQSGTLTEAERREIAIAAIRKATA